MFNIELIKKYLKNFLASPNVFRKQFSADFFRFLLILTGILVFTDIVIRVNDENNYGGEMAIFDPIQKKTGELTGAYYHRTKSDELV